MINDLFELRYDTSMARGVHNFKAGLDFRYGRVHEDPRVDLGVQGVFNFANFQTAQAGAARSTTGHPLRVSCSACRQRLPRRQFPASRCQLSLSRPLRPGRNPPWPPLTLNVGLRYDLPLSRIETNQVLSAFDPDLPNPAAGGLPARWRMPARETAAPASGASATRLETLRPRIGMAYLLTENTVLRAGGGIYYSGGNGSMLGRLHPLRARFERDHPMAVERL